MRRHDDKETNPQGLKRKLTVALVMLLISSLLMGTTSYAWFVLSTAPEVTGITTNVGANGSLEIALLNEETYTNLSKIKTAFNASLQQRENGAVANESWGNMVDLSFTEYGLGNIVLMPARLDVTEEAGAYTVDTNLLVVPEYGFDGRIMDLTDNALNGTFDATEKGFLFSTVQDYGVRAIGTSSDMTVQESALILAKSQVATYTSSANSQASSTLTNQMNGLFGIILAHSMDSNATYSNEDLGVVKAMVSGLKTSVNYIDLAMRQGIIAIGASEIADEEQFTAFVEEVNTAATLQDLLSKANGEINNVPADFQTWVTKLEKMENDLTVAETRCNNLTSGVYTWSEITNAMAPVINTANLLINGKSLSEFDKNSALDGVEVRLAPGSGVFADIADFADDYSVVGSYSGIGVTMNTSNTVNPNPHLIVLRGHISELTASGSDGEEAASVALTTTYGYAIDLAFRSNAAVSDLLLQTTPEQRIYDGSSAASSLGGGSYMEFSTEDSEFTLNQMLKLMDSVRVAFVDNTNTIMAVAKLNTVNRTTKDGLVKAPLYLYEFSISEEDGSIVMGERLKNENTIVALQQNVAKAVTAIVWLDGDIVDNTMVSAKASASLNGVLNLQFASSADLLPAENGELLNITTSKTSLETLLEEYKDEYEAGQGLYTTESWNLFASAYEYAKKVNEDFSASQTQVYIAAQNLVLNNPAATLVETNMDALNAKITEIRQMMGQTDEIGAYVVVNDNGTAEDTKDDYYEALTEYTSEQINGNKGTLKAVDGNENLIDAGNGAKTVEYSAESWSNLAKALYSAEAIQLMGADAEYPEVNAALEALTDAQAALVREIYFTAYDLNGTLYYKATSLAEDNDAYGKWYDGNFDLVTAEILMLDLNAGAEKAEIAVLTGNQYLEAGEVYNPVIQLQNKWYTELNNDQILGVHWSENDLLTLETGVNKAALNALVIEAIELGYTSDALISAQALLADPDATADVIDPVVAELEEELENVREEEDVSNTGVTVIPVESGHSLVTYNMYYPAVTYTAGSTTGEAKVSAWILTKNGVIYSVEESVSIYEKATGVTITPDAASINVDGTVELKVELVGGTEKISSIAWSTDSTETVNIDNADAATCTVKGLAAGTTTVNVLVKTVQGGEYSASIEVTVNEVNGG